MTLRLRTTFLAGAMASTTLLLFSAPVGAQAVVQALPPPALADLNSALADLARSPRSVPVLLRAAWAAVELEDEDAALGFFRRAEAEEPANGQVKAGMGMIELRRGNPVAAIRLFGEAEASGVAMARFAADRGLAYDLVGDNATAQRFYTQALARGENPEVTRRFAISQAISGDQRSSEATLLPLLQRSDLAAYRARAFAMAILGKSEEAVSIAQTMLPGSLSNRMAPYLRYMPRLTRAQQAAAANLGRFPPADQIGRDSPAIAALAQQAAPPVQLAARTPDARLEPSGQPLGRSESATAATRTSERRTRTRQQASSSPASPRPMRIIQAPPPQRVGQPVAVASPAMVQVFEAPPQGAQATPQPNATPPEPAAQPVVVARSDVSAELPPASSVSRVVTAEPPPSEVPRPTLSVAMPASTPAVPTPSAAPASQPAAEPVPDQRTLADAFAEFAEAPAVVPAPNAVDITRIEVRREKPPQKEEPKVEKPKPPAYPSRVWVQVATGRDTSALGFDWRRISREAGPLLAKREPYVAKWGQTNRLVTGPYASEAEARKAVTELKKKGLDSFTFTSEAGEAVNPLK